jgi:hypothetical protein
MPLSHGSSCPGDANTGAVEIPDCWPDCWCRMPDQRPLFVFSNPFGREPSRYFPPLAKRLYGRSEASFCASMTSAGWSLCFEKSPVHTLWIFEMRNSTISKVPSLQCQQVPPANISNHTGSFDRLACQHLSRICEWAFCMSTWNESHRSDGNRHVILRMWSCFSNLIRRSISDMEMQCRISNVRAMISHNWWQMI